jgi:hypothetical protein
MRFDRVSFRLLDHTDAPTPPSGHVLGLSDIQSERVRIGD